MSKLIALVAALVFAGIYLLFSVVAYGGFAAFFAQPAFVALAALLVVLSIAAAFAGGNVSRGVRESRELDRHRAARDRRRAAHRARLRVGPSLQRARRHSSALGWVLVFRSLVGVLLTVLLVPVLVARMNAEERLLASEFGEQYATYRARTWRMVPRIY